MSWKEEQDALERMIKKLNCPSDITLHALHDRIREKVLEERFKFPFGMWVQRGSSKAKVVMTDNNGSYLAGKSLFVGCIPFLNGEYTPADDGTRALQAALKVHLNSFRRT